MYEIGDIVRYCQSGICVIERIDKLDFAGEKKDYYVLVPIRKAASTVFVPVDNELLLGRMTSPLKKEEIESITSEALKENVCWIKDFRKRCDFSRKILQSNDRKSLVFLIRTIYVHKNELAKEGKYIHNSDDYILKDAEELLFGEISFVLKREYYEVQNEFREILSK